MARVRYCLNVHEDLLCNGPQGHDGGCVFVLGWNLARELEDELRETRADRDEGWRQHNQAEIGRLNAESRLRRAIETLEYMGGADLVVDDLRRGLLDGPSQIRSGLCAHGCGRETLVQHADGRMLCRVCYQHEAGMDGPVAGCPTCGPSEPDGEPSAAGRRPEPRSGDSPGSVGERQGRQPASGSLGPQEPAA